MKIPTTLKPGLITAINWRNFYKFRLFTRKHFRGEMKAIFLGVPFRLPFPSCLAGFGERASGI
jgi:hypothetical protein